MNEKRVWALWLVLMVGGCKAEVASFDFENLPATELTEYDRAPAPVRPDTPIPPEQPELPVTLSLMEWTAPACEDGAIPLAGSSTCSPLGAGCTESLWATGISQSGDIYVSPGASGDGSSIDSALGTIQAALDLAAPGATLWLSKGTFSESVTIDEAVTIQGACVNETIVGPAVTGAAAVRINSVEAVSLANLTITGGDVGVSIGPDAGSVDLESSRVRSGESAGIVIDPSDAPLDLRLSNVSLDGAELTRGTVDISRVTVELEPSGANLRVSGTALLTGDTVLVSRGDLLIEEAANVTLTTLVLGEGSITVNGNDASVTLNDTVVDAVAGEQTGISLKSGILNLVSVGVSGGEQAGIEVSGEGTSLYGRDLWVEGIEGAASALEVSTGGYASIERTHVTTSGQRAVGVTGQYSELNARSLTVVRPPDAGALDGQGGIVVTESAWATLTRIYLEGMGLYVASESADVDGINVTIEGASGVGMDVLMGASLSLERARVEGARTVGVRVTGLGTDFRAQDLTVRATQASSVDAGAGYGLQVSGGASVVLERTGFYENREAGVLAAGVGTGLTASDLTVSGTVSRDSDGVRGGGIYALEGIDLQLVRAHIEKNQDVGVGVYGSATKLLGSSVFVEETVAASCKSSGTCMDTGSGLFCEEASCLLVEFELSRNEFCGLVLKAADETESWPVDWFLAQRGLITENAIGMDIQLGYFDPRESLIDVYNFGNSEVDFSGRSILAGEHPEIRLD